MKELLFKQFITEVKAAKQERIDKVVEIIDNACETVTEFDLQFCLLEVKANFDSLIMGGTKYTNFKDTRDAINEKYTNVETFKAGLVEFKDALLNRNKSTETTKEEVKTVESKVGFTTVEEKQEEETVVDSNTTFTNTIVENNPVQQPVTNTITNKPLMQQVIEKCNQDAEAISRDLVQAEQILRESQTVNDSVEVSNVFINNMGMNMQGIVNNNPSVFNQPIVTDMEDNTNIYAPIVEEIVKDVVKEESKPKVKQQSKKDKNICKYEGCDNKTHTKGYCYKHYKQLKEEGVIGGNKNAK